MNEISPDQAFNFHRVPHEPRHGSPDPEPRLDGGIMFWQIVAAITPSLLSRTVATVWGVGRLLVWELPKLVVEVAVLDPIQRRRWRRRGER